MPIIPGKMKPDTIRGSKIDFVILDELAGDLAPPRTERLAPYRITGAQMRQFVINMVKLYPTFMGGKDNPEFDNPSISSATLLSRVISALNYTPSAITILADPKGLAKKGFLTDADLTGMTLRQMTEHCSRPMLRELELTIKDHEKRLIEELAKPKEPPKPHTTTITHDELLGRVEIDCETGKVVRIIDDHESMGETLVDDTEHVQLDSSAETAKQSNEWGSW